MYERKQERNKMRIYNDLGNKVFDLPTLSHSRLSTAVFSSHNTLFSVANNMKYSSVYFIVEFIK